LIGLRTTVLITLPRTWPVVLGPPVKPGDDAGLGSGYWIPRSSRGMTVLTPLLCTSPPAHRYDRIQAEQGQEGEEKVRLAGAELPGAEGGAAEGDAGYVEKGDDGAGGQAQFQQFVVQVVAAGAEGRPAGQRAADQEVDGIYQRHGEEPQRQSGRDDRVGALGCLDEQPGHHEAEEGAAGIAEVDQGGALPRMAVVEREEAEQGEHQ